MYPRFYIYAARPLNNFDKFYRIPEKQQDLVDTLRAKGFEFSINAVEPCRLDNLLGMTGLLLLDTYSGLSFHSVCDDSDLDIPACCEVLMVITYSCEITKRNLEIVKQVFKGVFGLAAEYKVTRSCDELKLHWTPQPRVYAVAGSSVDYSKNFC